MDCLIDIDEIRKILPHRHPFLFIDKVIELNKEEKTAICIKEITSDEYFLSGHFPGNPIFPGVLIVECMAQAGIILYHSIFPYNASNIPDFYLGRIESSFRQPVMPGDTLRVEIKAERIISTNGIIIAKARVGNTLHAKATIVIGVRRK